MTSLPLFLVMTLGIFPSAIAFFLLLFFKTHFVVEYGDLLGLGKFLKSIEFRTWELQNGELGYPVFLREKHNNFFTRLLGCPWCLSVWLSNFAAIFVGLAAHSFLTTFWSVIYGYGATFSMGFTAMMLYTLGIKAYRSL